MKIANIQVDNQKYNEFILIETMEELNYYIKNVLLFCVMAQTPDYIKNLRNAISEGEKLVFNPNNNVSYFNLPNNAIVTIVKQ